MTDRRRPRRSGGYESGFLINRSGESRYHKQGDIEHVLRYVLRQRGPIPLVSDGMREEARRLAQRLYREGWCRYL